MLPDVAPAEATADQPQLYFEAPETLRPQYAYDALKLYSKQGSRIGYQSIIANDLNALLRAGYPEDSAEVYACKNRMHTSQENFDQDGRMAADLFGRAIGIETVTETIEDRYRIEHVIVTARNPDQRIEFAQRYRIFHRLYALPVNADRRRRTQDRKAPLIIPPYSNIDRYYDVLYKRGLPTPEQACAEAPVPRIADTYLNEPGEPVLAVSIIESYALIQEALSAFGVRNGRLWYNGSFIEREYAFIDKNTSHLQLPPRGLEQSVKSYCNKLSPDQILQFAKQQYARATGFTALRAAPVGPEHLVKSTSQLNEEARLVWRPFWRAFNGWEDDSNSARQDFRKELQGRIRVLRASKPKARRVSRGRRQRPGQVALNMFAE